MKHPEENHLDPIETVIQTVHRLRAPGGCPWDQKQTHESLKPHLIEEAYEVLEVIENTHGKIETQKEAFKEELGDLLMQVLIHCELAQESGLFDFKQVAQGLNDKLIRRHPHVFGDKTSSTLSPEQALHSWNQQKAKEKQSQPSSSPTLLSSVPKNLPALMRAEKVIQTVSKVGFQWPDLKGPLDKVEEELGELKKEIENQNFDKASEELGDLLFSLCNIAYKLKKNPEELLRNFLIKFQKRFDYVESQVHAHSEGGFSQTSLETLDQYWNEAKSREPKA
jgi:tetrapyrrole methylase family protein/MazG family protein